MGAVPFCSALPAAMSAPPPMFVAGGTGHVGATAMYLPPAATEAAG